jgi:hypothetical protein
LYRSRRRSILIAHGRRVLGPAAQACAPCALHPERRSRGCAPIVNQTPGWRRLSRCSGSSTVVRLPTRRHGACGQMTTGREPLSSTSQSSCIATQRPEDIEGAAKLADLGSSAGDWARDQPRRGGPRHRRRVHRDQRFRGGVNNEASSRHGQDRQGTRRYPARTHQRQERLLGGSGAGGRAHRVFRVPETGGRATDPTWTERRQLPLRQETLDRLEYLAARVRDRSGGDVHPMQLAALLLERATDRASEEEAETLVRAERG